jgi:hypothetical protein
LGGADIGAPVVAINPMLRQPQCWHAHQAEHTWWLRLELLNYERDKNVERERAMREREERIARMEQVTRTVSRWQWRWVPADPPRSPPFAPTVQMMHLQSVGQQVDDPSDDEFEVFQFGGQTYQKRS